MTARPRRLRPILLVIWSLVAVLPAAAQGRDKGVHCSVHGNVGSCDGTLECDRLWADHVQRYHRGDGSGLDNVAAASFSPRGTPINLAVRSLILGGGIGAMLGSFAMKDDSSSHALAGALGGGGLFLTTGVIANRGAWGVVSSTVLGAAGGAMLGASVGKVGEQSAEGTPERAKEEESTASSTAAGAAAGFAAGFALGVIARQEHWPVGRWFGPHGRARLVQGRQRIGVVIAW